MFTLKYSKHLAIIIIAFLSVPSRAKNYGKLIHTETEDDLYSNYHATYQPLYKLKAAKEYIYKTVPVYVDYAPKVQSHVNVIESPKSSSLQVLETPETDYGTSDVKYFPQTYTVANTVMTPTASHIPLNAGVSEVQHLTNDDTKEYKYGYRVSNPHTGTEFGHSEVNDGHTAKGYYHVLLPDGRLQNVKYWAGDSGFNAVVSYEK